ncbi:DUF434 domain-containing protein [Thalassoroseus pseudoceratinae]|uniref:DUF434 domain-containing protein n=1 Tax=Thalassoroseus pseudoceratinae TaxID=2713176 RepID=UPI001F0E4B6D|nr:DUF5616 domain-containing protein [Thalassoroseus pseudoceratinae]
MELRDLPGQVLAIDGFNLITTLEAALAGGVVLMGRDHVARDMASMHGSYRKVEETRPALLLLGEFLSQHQITDCHWLLDRPVSNSGRLARLIREVAAANRWCWSAELVNDPDALLKVEKEVVVSADSAILDTSDRWVNLARAVIEQCIPDAWIFNLASDDPLEQGG